MNIEFAPSFKILLDSWNINTNVWLRNCVYKRVTPKGKKAGFGSMLITFLTSAFWVRTMLVSVLESMLNIHFLHDF
jgi:lysophospholipid acyltransferase